MFKSIQWRLVAMFVLLVVAVMLMFGTFLHYRVITFYHEMFKSKMNTAFSDVELRDVLVECASSDDAVKRLTETMDIYSGRLGINTDRNYYILDQLSGEFYAGSNESDGLRLEQSDNLVAARAGKIGDGVPVNGKYLDFAYPVFGNSGAYIVYIKDNRQEMLAIATEILILIAQTLAISIIFSIILGFILSKTITRPIVTLTRKAEGLARGDFESKIEIKSGDEIGKLSTAFNNMSAIISKSLKEISQEKNKAETILLYMNDGVIAFDTQQRVIHINPAAKEMLGIQDESEILFDDFFRDMGVDICISELVYLEQFAITEKPLVIKDRHYRTYFAVFKMEWRIAGVVVVVHDVTQSQRLDIARREFVANVSHELRTPLTTIKSYTETLIDDVDDPMVQKFLPIVQREVDRMTRIVKDLLTLSSLDSNHAAPNRQYFSLDALVKECVFKLSIEAKNKSQKLTYSPVAALPEISADRDRIEQVIINIISNSIKYTGEGGNIEVYAGHLYNGVYVRVLDDGIGIPKKDLPYVFERFYRVDKARTREQGGTGLGLAIAREILRQHGGSIKISSEYEKGTEVLITLPVVADS